MSVPCTLAYINDNVSGQSVYAYDISWWPAITALHGWCIANTTVTRGLLLGTVICSSSPHSNTVFFYPSGICKAT